MWCRSSPPALKAPQALWEILAQLVPTSASSVRLAPLGAVGPQALVLGPPDRLALQALTARLARVVRPARAQLDRLAQVSALQAQQGLLVLRPAPQVQLAQAVAAAAKSAHSAPRYRHLAMSQAIPIL